MAIIKIMNRKQWEKEQSWGNFIMRDMQYCRNKAESFEKFIFLMEKLGYEVKIGVHISVILRWTGRRQNSYAQRKHSRDDMFLD